MSPQVPLRCQEGESAGSHLSPGVVGAGLPELKGECPLRCPLGARRERVRAPVCPLVWWVQGFRS